MPVTGTTWGKVAKEFSAARTRAGGALLVLLAAVPAVAAYVVFATWIPGSTERYDAYQAAEVCDTERSAPAASIREDCLRTVTVRVDEITRKKRSGTRLTVTTVSAPYWTYGTSFGSRGSLTGELNQGDEITATAWRGDLMDLVRGKDRQNTTDEPRDEPQPQAALGTFGAVLAALLLTLGALHVVRPRRHSRRRVYTSRLTVAVGVISAVVGISGAGTDLPWRLAPPLILLLWAPVAYLILNWHRETRQKRARKVGPVALPSP
ncbi:hypothetical protein ABZX85_35340 [Streptomyces sp. NPDC004539]|uniref:hypothetical protein n=1 Tax=Streptomyces sp. NPDC004539 TaxID=3154280 RepID=UPI0033AFB223